MDAVRVRLVFITIVAMVSAVGCGPSVKVLSEVPSPAGPAAELPNLVHGADGAVYVSWVERSESGHALFFSRWDDAAAGWGEAIPVAVGEDWFVNWADFPSVAATKDGTLAAHWLAKVGKGTYAYGVYVSLSQDGGATWSEAINPHDDATETEHGFVSMVPLAADRFGLIWLDGREMAGGGHDGEAKGSMTLRFATLGRDGALAAEALLDPRVCDCCQTGGVALDSGELVFAYRDRSDSEVRDISLVRRTENGWSEPVPLHADGWTINGCPVNGPQLDAREKTVVTAWFTAPADDLGEVRVAFSTDGGLTFGKPIRADDGKPLGRVDVELLPDGTALVVWMEEMPEGAAEIRMRTIKANGVRGLAEVVGATSAERASGFPRMAERDGTVYLAWNELDAGIRTMRWGDE